MSPTSLTVPRIHQFAIGEQVGSADTLIGVLDRSGAPPVDVISGMVVNNGTSAFTFSLTTGKAAVGSIRLTAQPADGEVIVLNDGVHSAVTFEFDSDASVTQSNTLRQVIIGASLAQTVGALIAAIKAAPVLDITAQEPPNLFNSSDVSFPLANDLNGTAGNQSITTTTTGVVAGMAGGTGAVKNIRVNAASVASVVVKPRARVPFLIEIALADVQDFLNLLAVPAAGTFAFGSVTICYWNGEIGSRQRYVTA